jgi:hypothetical protein
MRQVRLIYMQFTAPGTRGIQGPADAEPTLQVKVLPSLEVQAYKQGRVHGSTTHAAGSAHAIQQCWCALSPNLTIVSLHSA